MVPNLVNSLGNLNLNQELTDKYLVVVNVKR